jgi:hypothetical protein
LCIQPAAHLPILSADVHAKEILVFAVAILARQQMLNAHWCRGARQAARRCDRAQPYAAWQTAFDPLLTPGAFN